MPQKVVRIPTLNDERDDFEYLFKIYDEINRSSMEICFDFSQCYFLRPNAVAFLGGLSRQIQSRSGTVVFDWDSFINDAVLMNLKQNGFAGTFAYPNAPWSGNSIPYREDIRQDTAGIMDYLTDDWIGRGWIRISSRLKDSIAGKMWEIYCNAFEHAESKIGVFSCGQHFPYRNELILTVVDFGRGIAANVRDFLRSDPRAIQLPAAQCLKWAFKPGTTTHTNRMARGIGLDILKKFIKINKGKLEVYSNEGYVLIGQDNEIFVNRPLSFDGTIFHITLICDEI